MKKLLALIVMTMMLAVGALAASSATVPSCEQAILDGLLSAKIEGGKATIQNNAGQQYYVSVASYKMYAALVEDQTLHDAQALLVAAKGKNSTTVSLPACAYQLDVVCGTPRVPPTYDGQVIAHSFGNQSTYCTPQARGNVTLSIAPNYPKGNEYVFRCNATGFVPGNYLWYYGDGQILPNTPQSSTYHKFAPGNYTVACTATNGAQSGTGVLKIVVPNKTTNATIPFNNTNVSNNTTPPVLNSTNTTIPKTNSSANVTTNMSTNVSTNASINISANVSINITVPHNTTNSTPAGNNASINLTNSTGNVTPPLNVTVNSTNVTTNASINGTNATNSTNTQTGGTSEGSYDSSTSSFSNGGAKHCARGWHRVGDGCERDPQPEKIETKDDEKTPVFTETPQPEPSAPAQPSAPAEPVQEQPAENMLTGNVTGAGGGASWGWFLVLVGMVAVGIGGYWYKKK